jgi:hypothetical protein
MSGTSEDLPEARDEFPRFMSIGRARDPDADSATEKSKSEIHACLDAVR